MNLAFFQDYFVVIVFGICLCIGFVIKNLIPSDKINKYIPLIMAVLGVILNAWVNMSFNPTVLLGGLFSGLASTGAYEAFNNLINRSDKNDN